MTPGTHEFRRVFLDATAASSLTDAEVSAWRAEHDIVLSSDYSDIKPILDYHDAGFPEACVKAMESAGFEKPFPIQAQSWPILMSGHDFIGIAETGSGKTLSFLLPATVHILDQPPVGYQEGPIALVLGPTRELVQQIKACAEKFCPQLKVASCYGGEPKRRQLNEISRGCDLLAACPGRVNDFINACSVSMKRVTYLILDEADRMLECGFEPQIRSIIDNIRDDRQTVFFSATWPKPVKALARELCHQDPIQLNVGSVELKANKNVVQHVEFVREHEKTTKLIEIIKKLDEEAKNQRIIVFCETKRACDDLSRDLRADGHPVLALHGDKSQDERRYVLNSFKNGRYTILCATDVAARGLDIKDVKVVINYDCPQQLESYIHRIGRTGRAGSMGVSYTFFTDANKGLAKELVDILRDANQHVPDELLAMSRRGGYSSSGYGRPRYNAAGTWRSRGGDYGRGGRGYGGGRRDSSYSRGDYGRGRSYEKSSSYGYESGRSTMESSQ